jgi:predicted anti-sigma-YlaC factor YlaD
MNCRRFQLEIYEYLDRSLSPRAHAAAEEHLSACGACRQMGSRERQIAQSLSDKFRAAAGSLQLPPEVGRRVIAALAEQRPAPDEEQGMANFWRRWALPLAIATSGLLLLAGFFFFVRPPGPGVPHSQPQVAQDGVSVHLSYVVPIYTFRREGGFVIDALTYQTNIIDERLGVELTRLQ